MKRPSKEKSMGRLRKALNAIPELKQLEQSSQEFTQWRRNTRVAIRETFGEQSNHIKEFKNIRYREPLPPVIVISDASETTPETPSHVPYIRGLESAASLLESMIEEINEYWEDESKTLQSSDSHKNEQINTKEVFIVHGRDEGAREKVARLLERLELKPVVLHEQPNEGRTIIEKFEDYTQVVGFAVILLTPDDEGRLKEDGGSLKSRARQNVVFELGYFIGKLGRGRVCALLKGDVERPSDYDGVLYIPLHDSGGWEMRLIQELKSAGYDIDANRAFAT